VLEISPCPSDWYDHPLNGNGYRSLSSGTSTSGQFIHMDIQTAKDLIGVWAIQKVQIKTVYVYGSRHRGDFRDNSDLDIAIELKESDLGQALAEWIGEGYTNSWKKELSQLLPWEIHIEQNMQGRTPTVLKGINSGAELIFQCLD
jgi:predicted nucleotidyltransferase